MHKLERLNNGLSLTAESMPHMESAAIGIWIKAGGRYETKENNGISHLLEHLLFKGTSRRDMMTIKQEIEGRGGNFNGFTSEEYTCYLVKMLGKDAELGVDILSDMVLNPLLADAEIEKEKNVIVEEINMYRDMPSHHVHDILAETMWPDQPLGMPLAGTVESVKAITRNAIVNYKSDKYNPVNMVLIGAGRIQEDLLKDLAGKYIGKASGGNTSVFETIALKQTMPAMVVNKKDTEQTHIAIGMHTFNRSHPDRYALGILNILMGANMSSRLFHIVRDEMALCYEIGSSLRKYGDCGAFIISAGVDHNKLMKSLEVILKEVGRTRTESFTKDEIVRAKEYYRGQLLFALEDTMSYMLWLGEKMVTGDKDFNSADILRRIDAVSAEDLTRVANTVFNDKNLNLAVIGPLKEGEDKIRQEFHF